jgi:hypothetical protein
MRRGWIELHVEPIEAEEWDEEYHPNAKNPHQRAIWRGMELTTMHNDEVHEAKNDQQSGTTERTIAGT